ncbi:MAG: DUF5667 domain-containing protein [Candidatus Limnocylindria bacterium]
MLPRPEPRDAFTRALRAQLMAQAPGVLARRETTWSRFQGSWLKPAVAFAAVALLLAGGAGKAAADSLPGDAAFGLKAAVEQLQLAFALDDTTRLRILAQLADHRLAELAAAVSARPNHAPAAEAAYATAVKTLADAVETLRAQPNVSQDKKTAAEDIVQAAHRKSKAVLDELTNTVSPSEQPAIDRAKKESDTLRPSGRPARTPEPSNGPDRTGTPEPARTAEPSRTPARSGHGGDKQDQRTASPRPARTPEPTDTPNTDDERRSATPAPTERP